MNKGFDIVVAALIIAIAIFLAAVGVSVYIETRTELMCDSYARYEDGSAACIIKVEGAYDDYQSR